MVITDQYRKALRKDYLLIEGFKLYFYFIAYAAPLTMPSDAVDMALSFNLITIPLLVPRPNKSTLK